MAIDSKMSQWSEEMLGEVEGERGSLPMVAFAAARLWEKRDREQGLLTREAYGRIGGVGGALAQHAETTLERIGQGRIHIVRELFRNLVTAEGTRAARDRDELLSVFDGREGETKRPASVPAGEGGGREAAAETLETLIDARLLTSYDAPVADEAGAVHHRIEIVHESLLTHWPRLVRWQMQDAEGAKLRDELRNQALLWEQHGRSIDYLWTGAAYLDYLAWRERYPGGLSTTEEEFARAMTAHAERRKRRRRIALAATFVSCSRCWRSLVASGAVRWPRPVAPRRPSSWRWHNFGSRRTPQRRWPTRQRASSLPIPPKPASLLFGSCRRRRRRSSRSPATWVFECRLLALTVAVWRPAGTAITRGCGRRRADRPSFCPGKSRANKAPTRLLGHRITFS